MSIWLVVRFPDDIPQFKLGLVAALTEQEARAAVVQALRNQGFQNVTPDQLGLSLWASPGNFPRKGALYNE